MEKIVVNPLSVRGLGDIVSPKSVSDFDVFDTVLSSSTDTVNGVVMTVFTESYRSGSVLSRSGDGFVWYTDGLSSVPVTVLLKNRSGSVISGASVQCIVDDETVLSATTNSSGVASFNIPLVEGDSEYRLRFKYAGTSIVGGCSVYGRIFVGRLDSIDLVASKDMVNVDESVVLTATATGSDVTGESVPVPLVPVSFYENRGYYRLLDEGTVSCVSTGANYCYGIGFDDLGYDLSDKDFVLEFDYRNTGNGCRFCLGDASKWSTGGGAGDNYIYVGTSTAGNGGYGTKSDGVTDNSSTGAVSVDTVLHWRIARTGDTIKYYLDGVLKGSKSVPDWVSDCHSWSLYFQCWNTADYTVENLVLDFLLNLDVSPYPAIVGIGDKSNIVCRLSDVSDGSAVSGATVNLYADSDAIPTVSSVSLSGDKSVLSAYDSDTLVLSATVKDQNGNGMSGQSVVFKKGSTTLATKQTNSSGVASYTYESAGAGDVSFTASVGSLVSETYSIEDCFNTLLTETTVTNSSGTKISSIGLDTIYNIQNTDFVLSFEHKGNGTLSIGSKSSWSSSTANYRLTLGYADSKHYYSVRTSSTTEGYGTSASTTTNYEYRIEREGTTIRFYQGETLIATKTESFLTDYSSWSIYSLIWGSATSVFKNIKLKPL